MVLYGEAQIINLTNLHSWERKIIKMDEDVRKYMDKMNG